MRKGSIIDLTVIITVMIVFVVGGLIMYKVYDAIATDLLTKYPEDVHQQHILSRGYLGVQSLVNMIPYIVFGAGIGVIILAFLIPTHPIFLPVSIIVYAFYIFLSAVFSNFLWEFIHNSHIIELANEFPLMVALIQYFPWVIAVFGAVAIIVMYGKSPQSEGYY